MIPGARTSSTQRVSLARPLLGIGLLASSLNALSAPALAFGPQALAEQDLPVAEPSSAEPSPEDPSAQGRTPPAADREFVPTLGSQPSGFAQRAIGVRGFAAQSQSASDEIEKVTGGSVVALRSVASLYSDWFSSLYTDELWFGRDGEDWSYSLSGTLAFGGRFAVTENTGPFLRTELRGDFRRQGGLFFSSLRLPGGEIGWTYVKAPFLIEAFAHMSTSLTGRFEGPAGGGRNLSGLSGGGAMVLSYSALRLDLSVSRIGENSPEGGIWDARAHWCSYWDKQPLEPAQTSMGERFGRQHVGPYAASFRWATCFDGSLLSGQMGQGDQPGSALTRITQGVIGFSIMIGRFHLLDPTPSP